MGAEQVRRSIGAAFLAAVFVASIATAASPRTPRASLAPVCPRTSLPFLSNPIAAAMRAAIAHERPNARPQITKAVIAWDDLRGRGGQVKFQCGTKAAHRTVVVYITLRAFLPSASLSQRVSFVSRFRTGWRVWKTAH
jgi:hypothetical protein